MQVSPMITRIFRNKRVQIIDNLILCVCFKLGVINNVGNDVFYIFPNIDRLKLFAKAFISQLIVYFHFFIAIEGNEYLKTSVKKIKQL